MALTRPRAAQIYDIDYKQATRVVTVANITLSGGAPSLVDGVTLSLNDRVLVTGQSTLSQNGIYYVTTVGAGSNGTWSRSLDTNNTGEILSGTIVMVTEGTIYADTQWKLITDGVINVGVTDQVWTQNYSANSISSGTSNVIVNSNANVTISSAGVANVLNITATGPIVTGNLLPSANITYNLGSTDLRWKDLWLSNSTLYLGNITLGASATTLTVNGSSVLTAPANADIQTAGNISAAGNITGNYFLGNVFYANGITASKIYSGNSEVNVTASGGNVNVSIGGTSNVVVYATTGEYVSGVVSATGNITGNYFIGNGSALTGIVVSAGAAITNGNSNVSVGANANVTVGVGGISNIAVFATTGEYITGEISATGNVTGNYYFGNGSLLSGIITSVSNINNGTSNVTVLSSGGNISVGVGGTGNVVVYAPTGEYVTGVISATGNVTGGNILTSGLISATGNITGNYIFGNGSQLSGITAGLTWTTVANTAPASPRPGDFWYNSYTDVKYQYTNDGTANYWVDQSYPTSFSTLAVTGAATIGTTLNVTGNTASGNLLTGGVVSATGNITGNYFFGNGSQLTGIDATSIQSGTSNVKVLSSGGNVSIGIAGNNIITVTAAGIINNLANGVGNIGNATGYFNTAFVKATSAQYADLAEYYVTDSAYPPGTVLVFGGTAEVTVSDQSHDTRTAGVVSTDPAYIMNATAVGLTVPVALTGRVPCRVLGPVDKGDRLVNIQSGVAGRLDINLYQPGAIIGKSLEDIADNTIKTIEIAVGRY